MDTIEEAKDDEADDEADDDDEADEIASSLLLDLIIFLLDISSAKHVALQPISPTLLLFQLLLLLSLQIDFWCSILLNLSGGWLFGLGWRNMMMMMI